MRIPFLVLMILTLIFIPSSVPGMASFDYPEATPVLSMAAGNVTIQRSGAPLPQVAKEGTVLASGDRVRTGPGSRCEISAATGKIRLYENTEIIIPRVTDEGDKRDLRGVDLSDGTGLFRIRKRGVERGFEVRTPHIIAGVKGTLFAVQVDRARGTTRVAVYSGRVEVTDLNLPPSRKTDLPAGRIVEASRNGEGIDRTGIFEWDEDPWREWERRPGVTLTMPSPQALGTRDPGRPAAGSAEEIRDRMEEDQEREAECPPVTDGSGNPIIY